MEFNLDNLRNNLKLLRLTNDMTQDELAAEIHIARSTYSTYETGVKIPDLQTIDALSALYGVSFNSLINYDLSTGLMHKIYFEADNNHLAEMMNSYQSLSVNSKNILLERIDALMERDAMFCQKHFDPLQK